LIFRFNVFGVEGNAVDGTHFAALWRIEVTDTFRALRWFDHIKLRPHTDRSIRALGFADVAVDALVGNHQGHHAILFRAKTFQRFEIRYSLFFAAVVDSRDRRGPSKAHIETMTATLTTIFILHWVVLVTPGANVLLISQLAASGQKHGAMFASLGVCTVTLVWATLAILGLNAVFSAVPQLRLVIQIAGGIYLVYIAIRLWRSGSDVKSTDAPVFSGWAAFRLGFLTNITNPKSALFFASVFATALPQETSATLLIVAVALVVFNALVWHVFLALAFSHPRVQKGYAKQRKLLTRVAGAIVGVMGAKLLLTSATEPRGS
jgi:threonine efflux protein